MPTLTTFIQHSIGSPSQVNQTKKTKKKKGKERKSIQIGKEVELSLFAHDMILYIENSNDYTKKLLELINEFSKIAG